MSQNAINYLKENKNKYSQNDLIFALKKAGYHPLDISESVKEVYGAAGGFNDNERKNVKYFFNFKDKYIYNRTSEKLLDFAAGPILYLLLNYIFESVDGDLVFIPFVFCFALLIYLFNRRRYLSYGLAVSIVFGIGGAFEALINFINYY